VDGKREIADLKLVKPEESNRIQITGLFILCSLFFIHRFIVVYFICFVSLWLLPVARCLGVLLGA
jgi:hypothetical protein